MAVIGDSMKSAYENLKESYEHALKTLQDSCPHKKKKWFEFWWAPGHGDGEVLVCLRCNKQLQRRGGITEAMNQMKQALSKITPEMNKKTVKDLKEWRKKNGKNTDKSRRS